MSKHLILSTVPSKHKHKQCLQETVMRQLWKFETVLSNSCRKTDGTGILIVGLLIVNLYTHFNFYFVIDKGTISHTFLFFMYARKDSRTRNSTKKLIIAQEFPFLVLYFIIINFVACGLLYIVR